MAVRSFSAAVLALSCALLVASCVRDADLTEDPAGAAPEATEPTGDTRQPVAVVGYKPEQFPFVAVIKDDGKGKGGGWQVAKANLDFTNWVIPRLPRTWWCPITVGMPLRNEAFGRIPPSRAATITVPVAEDAARSMDFHLPPGIFCKRFVAKVLELFEARHPRLGAKVTQ